MSEIMNKDSIKEIARLVTEGLAAKSVTGGNTEFIVIPDGHQVKSLAEFKYNEHAAAPERIKQTVNVVDAVSFIEYHKLFSDSNTRIFADESGLNVLAVLDYHGAGGNEVGGARWGSHKLNLALVFSPEWDLWSRQNNQKMEQMAFAEFLEQNARDIVEPAAAAVIDTARELEGKTEATFGASARTQSGAHSITYNETTTAKVGNNKVEVPDKFKIRVPVFFGGDKVDIEALLRYRVEGGKVKFFFTLIRPKEAVHAAFLVERAYIAKGTAAEIINGNIAKP